MLIEEVKKLKVAELRAVLRERGLDPRGLKAELVARLLSAMKTTEPDKSVDLKPVDTEHVLTAEEPPEPTCQTERTAMTALGDKQQTLEQNQSGQEEIWTKARSCVDQSTQTENDTEASLSLSVCSCSSRREEADQVKTQCVLTSSASSDVHQEEVQSTPLYTSQHCESEYIISNRHVRIHPVHHSIRFSMILDSPFDFP